MNPLFIIVYIICFVISPHIINAASKVSVNEALQRLKEGNRRFVAGERVYPNSDSSRLYQAGTEDQKNHAYATVIACSDSRVPVEILFDAGIMDIFVIRLAGNVCDTDGIGSIEYGLAHVNTPILVVLGHTQCGAVTAVTHAIHGTGNVLERNIIPLVDNIIPAVKRAILQNSHIYGNAIVPYATIENVWQSVEDLFMKSPFTRNIVKTGKIKVVGAIYDVKTGKINWLPEDRVSQILNQVISNDQKIIYN